MRREGPNHRLKGWFYPCSRPPNGLPPRSCVIYVERSRACSCLRQRSVFSRDPLSLSKPARHHRVKINKSSPQRVRAKLKLKKCSFSSPFFAGWNNSRGEKRSLCSELKEMQSVFVFIFRRLYPAIRARYSKTTIDREKDFENGEGGTWG